MLTVTCHVSRVRSSHLHVARVPHQLRPSVSPQTVSTTAQQQSTAADLLWLCGCTGAAPLVQILSAELNLLSCPGQTAADWQCRYNYLGAQIPRYPSLLIMHMHKRVYAAPSCRSMTFSAPLCCSVVQDTRAVHPHTTTTTTTTTTAMIPALCASCRGKGWRLFSPLALTLAESWCTLHASSWYF